MNEIPENFYKEWDALIDRVFAIDTIDINVTDIEDASVLRTAYSEEQPREPAGSSTGGQWASSGGFAHTGIEWKQATDKDGRPIPIKVNTVEEGVELILQGKVVEVTDARAAYTLIRKLADMATEAKAAGQKAKDYDLCQVSVAGSNLFCAQSLRNVQVGNKFYPEGLSRIEMPQLGGNPVPGSEADKLPRNWWDKTEVDGAAAFITHLQGIGVKTTAEVLPASSLKATQREMVGPKVASMMDDKTFNPATNPVFISSDGYVVDGHHRWAAVVGRDAEDGHLGDSTMNVVRVNAPISEVLHLATAWAEKFGIAQKAGVKRQAAVIGMTKETKA